MPQVPQELVRGELIADRNTGGRRPGPVGIRAVVVEEVFDRFRSSEGRSERVSLTLPRTVDGSLKRRNHWAVVAPGEHSQFELVRIGKSTRWYVADRPLIDRQRLTDIVGPTHEEPTIGLSPLEVPAPIKSRSARISITERHHQ